MEHQKIIKLLDSTPNQLPKLKTKNWVVEINDGARGTYKTNTPIKFKTSTVKLSLCDYSDPYILVKGTGSVANTAVVAAAGNNANKKVTFKYCVLFTDCISEINKIQFQYQMSMNQMINKFFLVYDKFLPEMHLRKPGVTHSAGKPFTKKKPENILIFSRQYSRCWSTRYSIRDRTLRIDAAQKIFLCILLIL